MTEMLIRIDAPHFVAGLLVEGGRVTKAAPILAWAVGKPIGAVAAYCARKRWVFDRIPSVIDVDKEREKERGDD